MPTRHFLLDSCRDGWCLRCRRRLVSRRLGRSPRRRPPPRMGIGTSSGSRSASKTTLTPTGGGGQGHWTCPAWSRRQGDPEPVDGARRLVRRNTPLGRLGDMHQVQVPTDPAGEADGPIPARGLGKHQVGPLRPGWELPELWRPDHRPTGRLELVAEGRVASVDDRARLDRQLPPMEATDGAGQAMDTGQRPELAGQLGVVVADQPGIQPAAGLGAWAAVEHDPGAAVGDQQPAGPYRGEFMAPTPTVTSRTSCLLPGPHPPPPSRPVKADRTAQRSLLQRTFASGAMPGRPAS